MKIITLLLSVTILSGTALADLQEDYAEARKQYSAANKAYNKIRYAPGFDKDGLYAKADAEYMKAAKNWKKVREEHPLLKKITADQKLIMNKMAKFKSGSDEFHKAKKELTVSWSALSKASAELPEMIAAKEKMDSTALKLEAVEKSLLAASPEATAALEKRTILSAKKRELRKKIKAQKK